jgi:nucleoside-diphosphate-sugar epimerase
MIDLLKKKESVKATFTRNSNLEDVRKLFKFYKIENLFQQIEWVEMNLTDSTQVYDAIKEVDHVYHVAAIVSFNKKDRNKIKNINIVGTSNVVDACIHEKVKKLGFISSVAAIGRKENKENIYDEKNKWSFSKANSFYAISKYKAENEVWRGIQEGLNAVITNPGIILGPSNWDRSSTTIFKQIHKGLSHYPSGINGFVDVRDVSRSIIELVNSKINAEKFIVVGENISYEKVFKTIAEKFNVSAPQKLVSKKLLELAWRLEAVRSFMLRTSPKITKETARTSSQKNYYSNEKIKTSLNYQFNNIEESIKNSVEFFLKFN